MAVLGIACSLPSRIICKCDGGCNRVAYTVVVRCIGPCAMHLMKCHCCLALALHFAFRHRLAARSGIVHVGRKFKRILICLRAVAVSVTGTVRINWLDSHSHQCNARWIVKQVSCTFTIFLKKKKTSFTLASIEYFVIIHLH